MTEYLIAGGKDGSGMTNKVYNVKIESKENDGCTDELIVEEHPEITPFALKRMLHAACYKDSYLCTFGGFQGTMNLEIAECYDKGKKEWTALPDLPEKRVGLGVVFDEDKPLIVGGYADKSCLSFDMQKQEYLKMPEMSTERYRFSLCKTDRNSFYAIGGWAWSVSLSSMEMLDTRVDGWILSPDMENKKHGLASVYCEKSQSIYVVGGCNRKQFTVSDVDRFDLRTNKWESLNCLPSSRMGAYLYKSEDYLFALGGKLEDKTTSDTIDIFDIKANKWLESKNKLPDGGLGEGYCM